MSIFPIRKRLVPQAKKSSSTRYKNPKTLKKKVRTISLKLILSNIVGALF